MGTAARLTLAAGVLGLGLSIANQLTAPELNPALERAAVLASLLAVGLMLVAILWTRAMPVAPERVALEGDQGLLLEGDLPEPLRQELAWGSQMLLTATPAAALLLQWRGRTLLRRGVLAPSDAAFVPGAICRRAWDTQRAIGLVNLTLYPGREEFRGLPEGIPSVIVQPLGQEGVLLLAGWSPRCFSRSDEAWLEGWALKLRTALEPIGAGLGLRAAGGGS
jgi:hypothetical protein